MKTVIKPVKNLKTSIGPSVSVEKELTNRKTISKKKRPFFGKK